MADPDVNPYTGQPTAMAEAPAPKPVSDAETKTFADWMVHDAALAEHEEAFRAAYGPGADQMMDMATLNLRLASCGIEVVVEGAPPAEPPPPPAEPPPA